MSSPDVSAIWERANQAQAQAQTSHPELLCRSGCNDCCKQAGSPITYAAEWQLIQTWLEERPQLLAEVRQRYRQLKATLQERLHRPQTPSLFEALFELRCPFIAVTADGERCSIYPVRPLTCRSFGNTLLKAQPQTGDDFYTCTPEKERWERDLPMYESFRLPLREYLFQELEAQDSRRALTHFLERYLYRLSQQEAPHASA